MSRFNTLVLLSLLLLGAAARAGEPWPRLSGPYLGQAPPGDVPELFAPGLASTGWGDRDLVINADGTEIYFCVLDRAGVFVRMSRLVDDVWSEPVVPSFSADPNYGCLEIALSADDQEIYFLSTRPLPDEPARPGWGNQNIFFSRRTASGWSEPEPAPGAVCTQAGEYYPSLTRDGTLYHTRHPDGESAAIWRSRRINGVFAEPERLPDQVNCGENHYNAFIAPDETYLIVCIEGKAENLARGDYYICFRDAEDRWSEAINLGPQINSPESAAGSAYVSPDGAYLFFSARRTDTAAFFGEDGMTYRGLQTAYASPANANSDFYWVSAAFLDDLRPAGWEKGD